MKNRALRIKRRIKMAKQLSMKQVKESNSIYNETVEIPIDVNGEEFIIKLKPYLHQESIRELIQNYADFLKLCEKKSVKIKESEEIDLLSFFTVKHTTDIKFTSSKKAKTIYDEFQEAKKSKLFKVILESIPEETHNDIWEYAMEVVEVNAKLQRQMEQLQDEFKNLPLENRDVIEGAFKDKPFNVMNDNLKSTDTPIQ
jgi:hypothetical protein